jgi:hypothetical protein
MFCTIDGHCVARFAFELDHNLGVSLSGGKQAWFADDGGQGVSGGWNRECRQRILTIRS